MAGAPPTTQRFPGRLPGYGGSAGHLVALLLSLALAVYAGTRMLSVAPLAILTWFVGAILLHDLVLFPAYSAADAVLRRSLRRPGALLPVSPLNYLRVPALLSAALLLVWFPLILRLVRDREPLTALPDEAYLGRWITVSAALFVLSAAAYGVRLVQHRSAGRGRISQNAE